MSSHPSPDGAAHLRLATGEESRGAPAPRALRVTLVDDDALVMAGFQALLAPFAARVEATCSRGVPTEPTDVALFDCFAAPEPGWATLARLRDTAAVTRLVVYTNDPPQAHVGALTDFGVAGVLTKHATADELVTALERVARGERVVDPAFPVELGDDWWPGRAEGLTEREAQAVTLICRGLPNGAIAQELNVSLNTLKSYIRSAYRTMGVASRSEAVLWGVARGLHVDGRP